MEIKSTKLIKKWIRRYAWCTTPNLQEMFCYVTICTYVCSGIVNIFDRHIEDMEDITFPGDIPTRWYSMIVSLTSDSSANFVVP